MSAANNNGEFAMFRWPEDALHAAARKGHAEDVNRLLNAGMDPNSTNYSPLWTPLHLAAMHGHAEAVEQLNLAGANPNAEDAQGRTPLHLAALHGHVEAVKQLVMAGSNSAAKDEYGFTPARLAERKNHSDVVSVLEVQERICKKDALIRAAENDDTEAVKHLLMEGVNPDSDDFYRRSALHWAAQFGSTGSVEVLIAAGADIEIRDAKEDTTPLMCAAEQGKIGAAKVLIDAGANPNVESRYGATALQCAVVKGCFEIVEALLEAGADPARKNKYGLAPLDFREDKDRIRELMEASVAVAG